MDLYTYVILMIVIEIMNVEKVFLKDKEDFIVFILLEVEIMFFDMEEVVLYIFKEVNVIIKINTLVNLNLWDKVNKILGKIQIEID